MNTNITNIFIIEDEIEEKILSENQSFNSTEKNFILYAKNYDPKVFLMNPLALVPSALLEKIETDWFIFLKSYEYFEFQVDELEENNYYLKIKANSILDTKEEELFDNLIVYEKRLFNGRIDFRKSSTLELEVFNCYDFFPELQKRECDKYLAFYNKGEKAIDIILFLIEHKLLEVDIPYLEKTYPLEKANNKIPEYIGLYLLIVSFYRYQKDLEKAKNILLALLKIYPNSITINFELALFFYNTKDLIQAELFLKNCLLFYREKSYYQYYPMSLAMMNYLPDYYLGEIYLLQDNLAKSKNSFKDCLEKEPLFKTAEKSLAIVLKKQQENNTFINETDFKCEGCGNCCRSFDVNLSQKDIKNILSNRPDLKTEDFIEKMPIFYKANHFPKFKNKENKTFQLVLKTKPNTKECVFLTTNNRCAINAFKPSICKTFPFGLRKNNELKWLTEHLDFIKASCKHTLVPNWTNKDEMIETLNNSFKAFEEMELITKEWNKNLSIREEYEHNFMEYFLEKT